MNDETLYAFPHKFQSGPDETTICFGMTLRDYFAAKATEEDIKHYERSEDGEMVGVDTLGTEWRRPRIIYHTREKAKYRYADAMLNARKVNND